MVLYNDWNRHESWLAGGRPVGSLHNAADELNSGRPRTNPVSGRVEDLDPGPPSYKSSTLTTRPRRLLNYTLLLFFVFFFCANSLMGLAANYSLYIFLSLPDVITWISSVKTRSDSAQWRAQFSAASNFKVRRITSIHSAAWSGLFGSTTTGYGVSAANSTSTWNSSRACIHQYVPSCL